MKPPSAGGGLGGAFGAIAMSVVAGVLVAAAITPVVALSGMAATTAVDIFEKLPNHLNPRSSLKRRRSLQRMLMMFMRRSRLCTTRIARP
ncbi:hypothetical protein [Leucobacter coleopterorum]|uniref:hypothetical protein n=1 Tax=Leucobacter coleopterorum TaxID=2714933 RepID=UPI001FCC8E10|nr:hypothetical protein [Leucobacter coleopterorum]